MDTLNNTSRRFLGPNPTKSLETVYQLFQNQSNAAPAADAEDGDEDMSESASSAIDTKAPAAGAGDTEASVGDTVDTEMSPAKPNAGKGKGHKRGATALAGGARTGLGNTRAAPPDGSPAKRRKQKDKEKPAGENFEVKVVPFGEPSEVATDDAAESGRLGSLSDAMHERLDDARLRYQQKAPLAENEPVRRQASTTNVSGGGGGDDPGDRKRGAASGHETETVSPQRSPGPDREPTIKIPQSAHSVTAEAAAAAALRASGNRSQNKGSKPLASTQPPALKALQQENSTLLEQRDNVVAENTQLKHQIQLLKADITTKHNILTQGAATLADKTNDLLVIQPEVKSLKERLATAAKEIQTLKDRINESEAKQQEYKQAAFNASQSAMQAVAQARNQANAEKDAAIERAKQEAKKEAGQAIAKASAALTAELQAKLDDQKAQYDAELSRMNTVLDAEKLSATQSLTSIMANYNALKTAYDTLRTEFDKAIATGLKSDRERLQFKAALDDTEQKLTEVEADFKKRLSAAITAKTEAEATAAEALSKWKKAVQDAKAGAEQGANKKELMSQLKAAKADLADLGLEKNALGRENETLVKQSKKQADELNKLRASLREAKKTHAELQSQLDAVRAESAEAVVRSETAERNAAALNTDLAAVKAELSGSQARVSQFENRVTELEAKIKEQEVDISAKKDRIKALTLKQSTDEAVVKQLRQQLKEAQRAQMETTAAVASGGSGGGGGSGERKNDATHDFGTASISLVPSPAPDQPALFNPRRAVFARRNQPPPDSENKRTGSQNVALAVPSGSAGGGGNGGDGNRGNGGNSFTFNFGLVPSAQTTTPVSYTKLDTKDGVGWDVNSPEKQHLVAQYQAHLALLRKKAQSVQAEVVSGASADALLHLICKQTVWAAAIESLLLKQVDVYNPLFPLSLSLRALQSAESHQGFTVTDTSVQGFLNANIPTDLTLARAIVFVYDYMRQAAAKGDLSKVEKPTFNPWVPHLLAEMAVFRSRAQFWDTTVFAAPASTLSEKKQDSAFGKRITDPCGWMWSANLKANLGERAAKLFENGGEQNLFKDKQLREQMTIHLGELHSSSLPFVHRKCALRIRIACGILYQHEASVFENFCRLLQLHGDRYGKELAYSVLVGCNFFQSKTRGFDQLREWTRTRWDELEMLWGAA